MKESNCRCVASSFVITATFPMYFYNLPGKGNYAVIDWLNLYLYLYLYSL